MMLRLCWALVAVVVWSSAAPVLAQDKRAAILSFEGPRAAKLRDTVVEAVRDEVEVVPSAEVQGVADRLGADLRDADGRVAVARELEIDVYIAGRVERAGRNWVLALSAASGASGESAEVAELKAKDPQKLAKQAKSRALRALSSAIAQSERPAAEESDRELVAASQAAAEDEDTEDAAEEEDVAAALEAQDAPPREAEDDARPMALAIELSAGGFSRDLAYRENLSLLRGYDIVAPLASIGLQWFPAAHFGDGALSHVGLRALGQTAFGLSSNLQGATDAEFATSSSVLELGVRGRLPLSGLQLGADVSYGAHSFAIDSADTPAGPLDSGVPEAGYSYLRFHVDASLALGDSASLGVGAGVLPLLGLGEIESWFPQASGLAMEGDLHFAYALFSSFDLIASVGARRYAITFDPTPQDVRSGRPIAAGVVDQYVAGQLGLRFRLGGRP